MGKFEENFLKDRADTFQELILEAAKLHRRPSRIKKILKMDSLAISDLEEAYLTSRYLPFRFTPEKIKILKKLVAKLKVILFRS